MKMKPKDGYSLTHPMYQELVQNQLLERKIAEFETNDEIYVYPNPFTEKITVNINSKVEGTLNLELYNLIGVKVMEDKTFFYSLGFTEIQVDLSRLYQGLYFLKTSYREENDTKELLIKLLKQ